MRSLRAFQLAARHLRNPENDAIVARVDCTVDRKARVRDLKEVPLDGEDAIVRAES